MKLIETLARMTASLVILSLQLMVAALSAAVTLANLIINTMNKKSSPPHRSRRGGNRSQQSRRRR